MRSYFRAFLSVSIFGLLSVSCATSREHTDEADVKSATENLCSMEMVLTIAEKSQEGYDHAVEFGEDPISKFKQVLGHLYNTYLAQYVEPWKDEAGVAVFGERVARLVKIRPIEMIIKSAQGKILAKTAGARGAAVNASKIAAQQAIKFAATVAGKATGGAGLGVSGMLMIFDCIQDISQAQKIEMQRQTVCMNLNTTSQSSNSLTGTPSIGASGVIGAQTVKSLLVNGVTGQWCKV